MRCSIVGFMMTVYGVRSAGGQAPPATDIFLAPLSISSTDGRPTIGKPVNITSRPGYDNQPAFTPDSRSILFTSIHEDGGASRTSIATTSARRRSLASPLRPRANTRRR